MEAGQRAARELGYEVSDEEAQPLVDRLQGRSPQGKKSLSDDELDNAAGGQCSGMCGCWFNEW